MSDYIFAIIIPLIAIAIIFAWVPFLNFICPPCRRSFAHRGFQGDESNADLPWVRFETKRHGQKR